MTTSETQIAEIEAPAYLDDPKVLAYLEGTDADLGRLVLEEDGKLWAYSKRCPADLYRSSLEDMVALAFPHYAQPRRPTPKTGEPRGMLADFQARLNDRRPRINIGGQRQVSPDPSVEGDSIKVPVAVDGALGGFVQMDRASYRLLSTAPHRPHTRLFKMSEGRVTTVCRTGCAGPYVQPLQLLLSELGSDAVVKMETENLPASWLSSPSR